jgi:hypothetical protein
MAGLDDARRAKERRAPVGTGAVRLNFALLIAERESVFVTEDDGLGHLFKRPALLPQHFVEGDSVGVGLVRRIFPVRRGVIAASHGVFSPVLPAWGEILRGGISPVALNPNFFV